MSRRGQPEIPDGIEVIGRDDGGPTTTTTTATHTDRRGATLSRADPVLVLAALLLAVGAAIRVFPGSGSSPEPELAIFASPVIDLTAAERGDFPLFGQTWDQHIAFFDGTDIVSLDPNTGQRVRIGPMPCVCAVADLDLVAGRWRARTAETVLTLTDGAWEEIPVLPDGEAWTHRLLGDYIYSRNDDSDGLWQNLRSGEVADADNATAIDESLVWQIGNEISIGSRFPNSRRWAAGELLASGPQTVVWRECDPSDQCTTWAGSLDQPRAVELDGGTVDEVLDHERTLTQSIPDTVRFRVVSADGRTATIVDPEQTLVDLRDGRRTTLGGTFAFPRWDDSGRFFAVPTTETALVIVDIHSGATAVITRLSTWQPLGFNPTVFHRRED